MNRSTMRLLAPLALLALSGGAHAQPAPCVPYFHSAELVAIDGNAVRFCDDETPKKQKCFAVDLASGKLTSVPRKEPRATATPGTTLSIDGKVAKACGANGKCKTFKPKARVAEGLGMRGDARGNLVVLSNMDRVETFDLKTGKRLGAFSAGKGDCTSTTILDGDVLLLQNAPCGDSEQVGAHWFATPKGKRIATVPADVTAPEVIDTHVAFVTKAGDEVIIQDGKTGKVAKRTSIGKPDQETWPELVANANKVVVVFGGKRGGDVAAIDLGTNQVSTFAARRCD